MVGNTAVDDVGGAVDDDVGDTVGDVAIEDDGAGAFGAESVLGTATTPVEASGRDPETVTGKPVLSDPEVVSFPQPPVMPAPSRATTTPATGRLDDRVMPSKAYSRRETRSAGARTGDCADDPAP